jgi:membrane-associated HD superfamily phosphohydrolase
MFESQGRTMTRHKIVIATIAVAATLLYALPAQNLASASDEIDQEPEFGDQDLAQRLVDDTRQRIDQDAEIDQEQEQEQEQSIEQELEQTNEADVDQSEENNQANVIETGDNTATATQIGDNDVIGSALAAEAEGGEGGEDDSKHYKSESSSSSGGSGGAAEASSALEQAVDNEFSAEQDSSANDNNLQNFNTFGDDVSVVDQDNVADQTAVNVGIQDQDQDADINQYATNLDLTAQLGEQEQEADLCAVIPEDVDIQGGGPGDRIVNQGPNC